MTNGQSYNLDLPDDFDEYLWDTKGYFLGAELKVDNAIYILNFYDPTRLTQIIKDAIEERGFFVEENVIVVKAVNRTFVEKAVENLVKNAEFGLLKQKK